MRTCTSRKDSFVIDPVGSFSSTSHKCVNKILLSSEAAVTMKHRSLNVLLQY